jgi:DNA polymerase-3 subunit delta'
LDQCDHRGRILVGRIEGEEIMTTLINNEVLGRFSRVRARGRLAHAYLFVGPPESGKTLTALALAKLLNCEDLNDGVSCDRCSGCVKINARNHPDIMMLSVDVGETIKIDDIRAFIQRLQLRAFEAKCKVAVIQNAERLTTEAANALLKTLEEPSRDTLMILTTTVPEMCLDTIKSRCHVVHFFPKSYHDVASQLEAEHQLNAVDAQCLVFFAQGSVSRAKSLLDGNFIAKKNKIINEMIMKRDSEEFLRKTLSDKEETQMTLNVLLTFFRDLVLLKSGLSEENVVNRDRLRDLGGLAAQFSFEDLNRIVGQIVKTIQLFKDNLNVKMSLSVIKELVFVKS